MYDLFRIQIPFKDDYVEFIEDKQGVTTGGLFNLEIAQKYGVKLAAGSVSLESYMDANEHHDSIEYLGNKLVPVAKELYMPYESIPSHNSTLAFKIFKGSNSYFPFVEIKASPAKLLQGHNVYGSTNVRLCIFSLIETFHIAYPELQEILDWENSQISGFDVNKTAHVKNEFEARQIIQALSGVSHGQIKPTHSFDTTALFNAGSATRTLEVYLKSEELKREIKTIKEQLKKNTSKQLQKKLAILESEPVQTFAKNAVRFETKIKKEWMKRRGIPTNLFHFIKYVEQQKTPFDQMVFNDSFQKLFKTFEGVQVNIFDESEVLKAIEKHNAIKTLKNASVKTNNMFGFYQQLRLSGYKTVKAITNPRTFRRKINEISEVIPKAQLMNLTHSTQNVVPMIRLINIDFENQTPAGYVEPLSILEQMRA